MSKQLIFHATRNDILPVISEVEAEHQLKYVPIGLFDEAQSVIFKSLVAKSALGISQHGDWNRDEIHMVLPTAATINYREVPQRRGGMKYAVDLLVNPCAVSVQFGGCYRDEAIIAGRIGMTSREKCALELFSAFERAIKKNMTSRRGVPIGAEAMRLAEEGWRLATNVRMPKSHDFTVI